MFSVDKKILSFKEAAELSNSAVRSVLLVRHSFRESLKGGNLDPGLTPEGREYALQCGTLLKGMKEVCFAASPRKRTFETVRALMEGGELPESPILPCPLFHDTALFSPPEGLAASLENNTLPRLLQTSFYSGSAPGMIPLKEYAGKLVDFLTGTAFEKPNVILASHDIVLVSLLSCFKVYPFTQEDWCGYIQGAFLYQDSGKNWTIAYTVPDTEKREKCQLFV